MSIYDANGTKLRTDYYINPMPVVAPQAANEQGASSATNLRHTWTEYCGNFIYENDTLKQTLIEGGYISYEYPQNTAVTSISQLAPTYHFYVQDHLGNNRLVVDEKGTIEQINHYYPYGGLMGESKNISSNQRYKYNGKEFDRMHCLDWYDYGASFHDPATGRWMCVDPHLEKYYPFSPYSYCYNNTINSIDTDGKDGYLLYWAGNNGSMGHSAFAVDEYKNGKPTGTMSTYGFFPSNENYTAINILGFDQGKVVKDTNVTYDNLLKGNFNSGESKAPTGIIAFKSSEVSDSKTVKALNSFVGKTTGYNAATRNCSDFAKIGVEISAQKKVSGKENTQIPLIGTQAISTPAALFRDTSALKNAEILKGNTQNIKNQLPSKISFGDLYKLFKVNIKINLDN